ncbi:EAL domain-containing protein [Ideonella sp.]|uniref:EAL domain-containing protein n=1 Tax=Ideonella sp. TaxID=1929293 RepID=UPI0035B31DB1
MSGPDAGIAWLAGQASARAELVDSLDDPAWLVDAVDATVQHANRAAAAWFGSEPAALIGRAADSLLPTLEDAAFWGAVRCGAPGALASDTELPRPGGETAWVHRRVVPIGGLAAGAAGVRGYLVMLRDRSGERRAEGERDQLLAELRATLEATADGILVTGLDDRIHAFNRRFAELWSLPESALTQRDDAAVYRWMSRQTVAPATYDARLQQIMAQALLSAVDTVQLVDGTQLERHMQPQWSQGRPIGRVFSFRVLNPHRRGVPRHQRAVLDETSGLIERSGFVAELDDAVGHARRDGSPLAVLAVEYDRDQLYALDGSGQARSLSDIVEGLRALVPVRCRLARLGGMRFGLLLTDEGEATAQALARRLVEHARADGGLLATRALTVSVGIATYPHGGLGAEDLLASAELALEHARLDGRSAWRVQGYDGGDDGARLARLHHALHAGGGDALRLRYLPRVDAATGEVQAIEALLRWNDGANGLLPPSQFLPLADKAGLAGALDDWALEHALQQAARWRSAGHTWTINVNLGSVQCLQPGLARRVAAALQAADWPAARLELDITEAALRHDPVLARAQLQALRGLGVRLLLDDFGRGEAGLNLLRRFPLDGVKLDRDTVHGLARGTQPDTGLATALAGAARACGLTVYAEGVESEAQRQPLAALGVSGWQGFLRTRPLDAASVPACVATSPAARSLR